jgi:hypothetical protein
MYHPTTWALPQILTEAKKLIPENEHELYDDNLWGSYRMIDHFDPLQTQDIIMAKYADMITRAFPDACLERSIQHDNDVLSLEDELKNCSYNRHAMIQAQLHKMKANLLIDIQSLQTWANVSYIACHAHLASNRSYARKVLAAHTILLKKYQQEQGKEKSE